jgi:hypothetical protein
MCMISRIQISFLVISTCLSIPLEANANALGWRIQQYPEFFAEFVLLRLYEKYYDDCLRDLSVNISGSDSCRMTITKLNEVGKSTMSGSIDKSEIGLLRDILMFMQKNRSR